jgi:hypothetical protein
MKKIIFYVHPWNTQSGGNSLFFILCDKLNKLYNNIAYIAPLICKGDGLIDHGYIKHYNIENIYLWDPNSTSQQILEKIPDHYYQRENYVFPEHLNIQLVTKDILLSRDNLAVYSEGIVGNPLQQKYVWRWILYFPTPAYQFILFLHGGKMINLYYG